MLSNPNLNGTGRFRIISFLILKQNINFQLNIKFHIFQMFHAFIVYTHRVYTHKAYINEHMCKENNIERIY